MKEYVSPKISELNFASDPLSASGNCQPNGSGDAVICQPSGISASGTGGCRAGKSATKVCGNGFSARGNYCGQGYGFVK